MLGESQMKTDNQPDARLASVSPFGIRT